ncbi:MAG: NADH-quinone oxidoreductase subunit NuoG [Gammaproteobacteria bacterium]
MARLEIDGHLYDLPEGGNLLAACLTLGLDLPYFCWHPALGSVGSCRQCAVVQYRDAEDSRGRLVMACVTPITDAMRISIAAEPARHFRSTNIELLMTNHPHDCPVCEEGGECHLQDMTVMTGHTFRRYRGRKRTHDNQDLGPFINHEMNRCIACYRCVRFYDDYAGGQDLQVLGIHNNVYFGRFEDGALENEFSGNLVEVCPTGVFTDKTFSAHYSRKWDLQTAPSICTHCAVGCNISPGERYGELRRVINRYHGKVNGYFLCDRGRFGYAFVNSPQRIRLPRIGDTAIGPQDAKNHVRGLLITEKPVIGIGSPRASLEANFALRSLVGEANFFAGLEDAEHSLLDAIYRILTDGGIHSPSLREIERADAVLILGEDVTHSAPRLALSLRQSVRNATIDLARTMHIPIWQDIAIRELSGQARSPLFIVSLCATRLDDVAAGTYRGSPDDIARLGFAVAHHLDRAAPEVLSLSDAEQSQAAAIAGALQQAKRPLVVSGTSCSSLAVIQAAYNIAKALQAPKKQLTFTLPECNSVGLATLGGGRLQQAFETINRGLADTVVILENDLYRRASRQDVDRFLATAAHVVVIDALENDTTAQAELLLPAATFAESEGTWVNNEGRAQRHFPVYPAADPVRAGWQWLTAASVDCRWHHFRELTEACAAAIPALAAIKSIQPPENAAKIPRQPLRYSGRTAMQADIAVSEPGQPQDFETPFAFSMEGDTAHVQPALLPVIWAPGWNSNQAINKFQDEIAGHLRQGEPGIRLFEASGALPWFNAIPPSFKPEPSVWRSVSLPHIFGSEELSRHSPPILERQPVPCVLLNPLDAETLAVDTGDRVAISDLEGALLLIIPARIEPTLAAGLLGVTAGLPEFWSIPAGTQVALTKIDREHDI